TSSLAVDAVADGAAQGKDAAVEMPGRMNPVGQQRPGMALVEIDPQPRPGETGVADRAGRAELAARPALVGLFPAMGTPPAQRLAHECSAGIARCVRVEGALREIQNRRSGAEQPGMP